MKKLKFFLNNFLEKKFLLKSHGRPLWENGPLSNEEFTMDGIFTIGEEKELNSNGHQQQNDLSISPSTSNLNIDNLVFNSNSSSPGIFF